jgi:hypothetical protein
MITTLKDNHDEVRILDEEDHLDHLDEDKEDEDEEDEVGKLHDGKEVENQ